MHDKALAQIGSQSPQYAKHVGADPGNLGVRKLAMMWAPTATMEATTVEMAPDEAPQARLAPVGLQVTVGMEARAAAAMGVAVVH